jgi:hypothetical protein
MESAATVRSVMAPTGIMMNHKEHGEHKGREIYGLLFVFFEFSVVKSLL